MGSVPGSWYQEAFSKGWYQDRNQVSLNTTEGRSAGTVKVSSTQGERLLMLRWSVLSQNMVWYQK